MDDALTLLKRKNKLLLEEKKEILLVLILNNLKMKLLKAAFGGLNFLLLEQQLC